MSGQWVSTVAPTTPTDGRAVEVITLGAGCFWCFDAIARRTAGILSSVVGYAGGDGPPPTYYDLHYSAHKGDGFVEAVQISFNPAVISLAEVLDLFFQSHDPTTPNRDGANHGPEYHSTVFYHDEAQKSVAEQEAQLLSARLGRPVTTSIRPFTTFHEGEPEHQDFYARNPDLPYCRVIISPKLRKLRKEDEPARMD